MGDSGDEGTAELLRTAYELKTGAETLDHYEAWAATYDQEIGVDKGYAQPTRCAIALSSVMSPMTDWTDSDSTTGDPPLACRVLDVGCGTGLSGLALCDAGFTELDGCDFSSPMLRRAADTGVYRRLFEADLNEGLDVDDGTYDAAAAVGVFSFGHIRPSALRDVLRVVRSGGAVVVGLNDHFWDEGDFPAELDAIEADGIATVAFREHGEHLPGAGIDGWVVVLVKPKG
ncbi:MAG: class I SAM-dependent methyltransferase [Acidimicrobiales bacterium]|jgi:SAM-dependent methyltransferase|nr:class I SAM-dependent methyltransferase [Acidimicrobiales bacterium]MDP6286450.1 class I SAM-dependent methyltransferase [Acidimicrobiales bacterium]MDP6910436.1 class I SAM-dependent methyltransferase [Acidimicrobiales bacterium]